MSGPRQIHVATPSKRLDHLLVQELSVSREQASKLAREGRVTHFGRPLRASAAVPAGAVLEVHMPTPKAPAPAGPPPHLDILYQDDRILALNKPAGIAMHPGAEAHKQPTLADALRPLVHDPDDPERPGIVHRLDKDTSGVIIAARDVEAKHYLMEQFASRQAQKRYRAIVEGRLRPDQAVVKLPIGRDPKDPLKRSVLPSGKPAETSYQTLAEAPGYSLVEARPRTGRTHQLRVHFAALGHPVAGDRLYGATRRDGRPPRQLLHAAELTIKHPDGTERTFSAPEPDDMKAFWHEVTGEL